MLAALDILTKQLSHAERCWMAGGLSTVVTDRAVRGLGFGSRLVRAARHAMSEMHLDVGLFTCDRPLQSFYERAGWQLLPGTVLIGGTADAPLPSDQPGFDKVTMGDFFSAAAQAQRRVFYHTRVGLHSGEIDKLW